MAKESFDLANANRREPTMGAGTGPFSRAPLPRSAAPPASTSPRCGTSRIRKHDTGSFHPFRRRAPAASSSCMLGTSANEQLTWEPRFTDADASDRRCRCRSAHPSRRRSPNAGPLVHRPPLQFRYCEETRDDPSVARAVARWQEDAFRHS
jgi:hypothetical protein